MLLQNMNNQENPKKHNGNRRYSILLLALLFIGMATYGTYAYFTDSTSVNGNIKLETGTVSLKQSTEGWKYNQNVNTAINLSKIDSASDFDFTNVQPGDSFTKTVEIDYTGSLDGTVTVNHFTDKVIEGLDYNIVVKTPHEDNKVFPGDKFTVTLTATLPLEEKNLEAPQDSRQGKTFNLKDLDNAVKISVVQLGAPTPTQP